MHRLGEKPSTRNWWDDGDDCLTGAFASALHLQKESQAPTHADIEAAYQRHHPHWDNRASTIRLAVYWQALYELGIFVEALHGHGDLIDRIAAALALGLVPVAWVYLEPVAGGKVWHHAVNITHYQDGHFELFDAQTGLTTWVPIDQFTATSGDIRTSGYVYVAKMLPF